MYAFSFYEPEHSPILEFDLKGGHYRVIIGTVDVVEGPPLRTCADRLADRAAGRSTSDQDRTIEITVELVMDDYQGRNPLTVRLGIDPHPSYDWPLPGHSRSAIAEFKPVTLDDRPAVRLIRLESDKLVND